MRLNNEIIKSIRKSVIDLITPPLATNVSYFIRFYSIDSGTSETTLLSSVGFNSASPYGIGQITLRNAGDNPMAGKVFVSGKAEKYTIVTIYKDENGDEKTFESFSGTVTTYAAGNGDVSFNDTDWVAGDYIASTPIILTISPDTI